MSDPGKAVFLSYASQDAEAARKICEALRAAGVEVWFDQSELRGGDAWDQKIRRQIRECALFVPVISPNTNARPEGYFRLEWKLAVDRSHLMADDAPFLFPIAIGDVTDANARVPDKFREVQWTRLRLDETPAELAARIQRLLVAPGAEPGSARSSSPFRPEAKESGQPPWLRYAWAGVGLLFAVIYAVRPLFLSRESVRAAAAAPAASTAPAAPAVSEARQLALKARALYETVDSSRDDFLTAESLMQRAVQLDPADGFIWAVNSRLNSGFVMRGFDRAPTRMENARSQMEKAIRLAPTESEAWFARGSFLRRSSGSRAEAEKALRRALELNPADTRPWFDLAWAAASNDPEQAVALLEKSIDPTRRGSGALARYNQFLLRLSQRRFAEADALIRQAVEEVPASNFVGGLIHSELIWKGDAAAAVAALKLLTPERLNETRSVLAATRAHLSARQPAEALADLRRLSTDYIADSTFTGPRAYWEGWAHYQLGNQDAARMAWESALAVARRETAGRTGAPLVLQAELLALLGRTAEAEATLRAFEQAGGSEALQYHADVTRAYVALGQVDVAVARLREELRNTRGPMEAITPASLRLDPTYEPIRGDPRFQALLAEASLPPARDWPKDPELKRALALVDGLEAIPDDFALAEEITRRVLDRAPTDVEALTMMARVNSQYLRRGFDRSDERSALARRYAERAVQLAPDEPQALLALATYLFTREVDQPRAERLLRRAMELEPQDPRHGRMLADLLSANGRSEEAFAQGRENVRLHPGDALSHYDYARLLKDHGRYEEFERALDATLAVAPLPNAIIWKARLQFGLHNDLAATKQWLDRVPERVRSTERAVYGYVLYAVFGGDPESGLEALRGFTEKWFADFEYAGPTALLNAELLRLRGRTELARQQYEVAWLEIEQMRRKEPNRSGLAAYEFWTLFGLGRMEEARGSYQRMIEGRRRPYAQSLVTGWWFTPIPAALLLGDRATALELLRESVATLPESRAAYRVRFQVDRRMAPFRSDPEIQALLADPSPKP